MAIQVHLPICSFDAKTGLLCPICEAKAKSGQITEADIEVSRALIQVADRTKGLGSVILVKSHKVDNDYLLEVREAGVPALRDPAVRDDLERSLGGRIWVTSPSSSNRQVIEDLVHPLSISALSTLWLPDGSRVSKAVVEGDGGGGRKAAKKLAAVQKLAKVARGIDLLVEQSQERHRPQRREIWDSSDFRTYPSGSSDSSKDNQGTLEVETSVGVAS